DARFRAQFRAAIVPALSYSLDPRAEMERQHFPLAFNFLQRRRAGTGSSAITHRQSASELPGNTAHLSHTYPLRLWFLARLIHNVETQNAGCSRSDFG